VKKRNKITQKRLKQVLNYNPDTGEFRWKEPGPRRTVGGIAGTSPDGKRHVAIMIDGRIFYAHRLAWMYIYGVMPYMIDHRDTNKGNNRISNLRITDQSRNLANRGMTAKNTSGYKGVYWNSSCKKWYALIRVRGERITIGKHEDPTVAHEMYKEAAIKYFGEFARW
jgi:hypothetical protein